MAATIKVKFFLVKSMASPKVVDSLSVNVVSNSNKKSVLRLVSFLFGKVSLGFVDKQGHRVIFNSSLCNLIVT